MAGHELSHFWWGNSQINPDDREGAAMLTETLAMYTEMMLYKKMYGKEKMMEQLTVHEHIYDNEKGLNGNQYPKNQVLWIYSMNYIKLYPMKMTNEIKSISYPADFPKSTMISVNSIVLEVFEAGQQNNKKPIVLCHGFPEHAYSWRYQIPVLVKSGYHVIVPNQRGYGNSSCPTEITDYDIKHLTGDLVALLDYYGYKDAIFVGHDWGANVVWNLALLHPERVNKVINLALPYQERGEKPWIEFMEEIFGKDFYFVHFNRQPGVADAVLERNTAQFLRNLFRKNVPPAPPEPGMLMINLARAEKPLGEPIMNEDDLSVFISAFESSGFTGCINWYRNLDRNWHLLAEVKPMIQHSTLMIYGNRDLIPKSESLKDFAPNLDVVSLDCGHWIPQEKPAETNQTILKWLEQQNA